jgi:hypothetical protein
MNKLREYVVRKLFSILFKRYEYPFIKSDELIATMTEVGMKQYFRDAESVRSNPVYAQEIREVIRYFYQELAINRPTREQELMHLGALMFAKHFDARLTHLASLSKESEMEE